MAFQYVGGVGASLARALTGGLQGYDEGIDAKLKRQQEQAQTQQTQQQTQNLTGDPILAFLEANPHASYQQATDYVNAARSGKVPTVPSPTGPEAPLPVGPHGMPSPVGGNAGDLGTPSFRGPSSTGGGAGSLLGKPSGMPSPTGGSAGNLEGTPPPTPMFAPAIPQQPPTPLPPSIMDRLAPVGMGAPPPPMTQAQALPPVNPSVSAAGLPPVAPPAAPPQAPPPPVVALPPPPPPPWTQRPMRDVVGQSQAGDIWGVRTAPTLQRNDITAKHWDDMRQHYGDQAMAAFQNEITKYSANPAGQAVVAAGYDKRYGTAQDPTPFTDSLSGGTGTTDKANYDQGRIDIGKENADTNKERVGFIGSADEQKAIKGFGDMAGFQQIRAVNAWNRMHPNDALPVPNGTTIPYYKPGEAEQALNNSRTAQAAYLGVKSKYYPEYIKAVIGKDQSGTFLDLQRGNLLPLQVQNQMQATNNTEAYNAGRLRLQQAGMDNVQARYNQLMRSQSYKALVSQDAALRTQIDVLNAQEEKAHTGILNPDALKTYLEGTAKLKADLLAKQSDIETQRSQMEMDPTFSDPTQGGMSDPSQTQNVPGQSVPLPVPVQVQPISSVLPPQPYNANVAAARKKLHPTSSIYALPPLPGSAPNTTPSPQAIQAEIARRKAAGTWKGR